jgi:hypothetical protein
VQRTAFAGKPANREKQRMRCGARIDKSSFLAGILLKSSVLAMGWLVVSCRQSTKATVMNSALHRRIFRRKTLDC